MSNPTWQDDPALVELVAAWFSRWFGASSIRTRDREHARDILSGLAASGRLILPADAEREQQYAVQWTLADGATTSTSSPYYRREHAEHHNAEVGHLRDRGKVVQRVAWVEPWQPAEEAS